MPIPTQNHDLTKVPKESSTPPIAWGDANYEIVMPLTGKQTVTIHTLPDISRSKDNQTIKFGQLIKYNKVKASGQHFVSP